MTSGVVGAARGGRARSRSAISVALTGLVALLLVACSIPADPEGTLDRVGGDVLRVGVTESEGWVSVSGDTEPNGLEPDLVREFAEQQGAEINWTVGSESDLVQDLELGKLDLVIGGFADDSPWSEQVGMTRPYTEALDDVGKTKKHVMFTRMGENAFLFALDRFLLAKDVKP